MSIWNLNLRQHCPLAIIHSDWFKVSFSFFETILTYCYLLSLSVARTNLLTLPLCYKYTNKSTCVIADDVAYLSQI